jgi:small subunit ribosomal protein S6
MLLLRPDLEDDKLQSAVEKVTRAIVNAGGSLSKVSPWGKRRLAYPIHHLREASYFLIHFDIEPSAIREIERGMLISEEILRHLVTVLEDRGPAPDEPEPAVSARGEEDGEESAYAGPDDADASAGTEPPSESGAADDEEVTDDGEVTDEGDTADEPREAAAAPSEG